MLHELCVPQTNDLPLLDGSSDLRFRALTATHFCDPLFKRRIRLALQLSRAAPLLPPLIRQHTRPAPT